MEPNVEVLHVGAHDKVSGSCCPCTGTPCTDSPCFIRVDVFGLEPGKAVCVTAAGTPAELRRLIRAF